MAMAGGVKGAVSQINVTPLIDVLLVLLIIFMVIVPAKPNGFHALLPAPAKGQMDTNPSTPIVVQVVANGTEQPGYRINSMDFAKAALKPKLAEIFAARQEKAMFLKADPELTFDQVAEVINLGKQAGVLDVAVLTPGSEAQR